MFAEGAAMGRSEYADEAEFRPRQDSHSDGHALTTDEIDVVRRLFAAFAERDVEAVLALAHPEVEFIAVTADVIGRQEPYFGHEGLRRYFKDVARVWEVLRLSPGEFRADGNRVLVTGRVSAHSPSRVVSGTAGWIWRVENGLAVFGRVYPSAAEAIDDFDR